MAEKVPVWSKNLGFSEDVQRKAILLAQRFLEVSPEVCKDQGKVYAAGLLIAERGTDCHNSVPMNYAAHHTRYSKASLRYYKRKILGAISSEELEDLGIDYYHLKEWRERMMKIGLLQR